MLAIINCKDLVILIYPQNLIIKVRYMNLDNSPFDSPQKETRKSSILKNRTDNKENMKKQPKGLSTTIRHSVRFKEQEQQNNVKQFNQSTPKFQVQKSQRNTVKKEQAADKSYTKRCFFKDVNNINYLYSNVLMLATQNSRKTNEKYEQKEIVQLNKAIQELIHENKQLKEQIDQKYTIQNDLHQLSEYLHCSVDDLIHRNGLQSFIEDYLLKQEQCKDLQQRCRNIEEEPKHKSIGFNQAYTKQKQRKCQALRKKIERQKNAIKKLQKEEAQLFKNLYRSQKEMAKNERLSSALKLKINQIEIDNEYRFSKSRAKSNCKKNQEKESHEIVGDLKHCKVNNKQHLKGKVSISKLLKKR